VTKIEYEGIVKNLQNRMKVHTSYTATIEQRMTEQSALNNLDDIVTIARTLRRRLESEGIQL